MEGDTDDPKIIERRERVKRSLLTSLFLSLGTPMLLAGDEAGRTQKGNNNAYCQDNRISWIDWSLAKTPHGESLIAFVARLAALRREYAVVRSDHFLHGQEKPRPDIPDIEWFDMDGNELTQRSWENPETRTLILRRASKRENGQIDVVALLVNASPNSRHFRLPPPSLAWRLVIDAARPDAKPHHLVGDELTVPGHTAMVVVSEMDSMAP